MELWSLAQATIDKTRAEVPCSRMTLSPQPPPIIGPDGNQDTNRSPKTPAAEGAPSKQSGSGGGSRRWKVTAELAQQVRAERAYWKRVVPQELPIVGTSPSPVALPVLIIADQPTDDEQRPVPRRLFGALVRDDRIPGWLVSLVVHMLALLLLAFLTLPVLGGRDQATVLIEWNEGANNSAPLAVAIENEMQQVFEQSAESELVPEVLEPLAETGVIQAAIPRSTLLPDTTLDMTVAAAPLPQQLLEHMLTPVARGELGDRSREGRAQAIADGSVSADSEEALERALRWIVNHQHNDGGWSFRLEDPDGPCKGKCEHRRVNADDAPIPRTAATGLCLLALMGAGHTHEQGIYAENIRRGIYFLQGQASRTSKGFDLQNGSMYGHGIAALALAEAFVLTGDEDLRELLQGTTMFAAAAQHDSGGWGYQPGGPPDITLTAWQVIGMQTSLTKGIGIPTQTIPLANQYVLTLANPEQNRFGYKTPEPRPSATAIGLLLQMYFGVLPGQTNLREGLDWIASLGPSETNVYFNYYAMLALHHSRHRDRMDFAAALQEYLIRTQATRGHEDGSWNFPDRYGSVGGRLYTTAMCALILETPYRYVPMYGKSDRFQL